MSAETEPVSKETGLANLKPIPQAKLQRKMFMGDLPGTALLRYKGFIYRALFDIKVGSDSWAAMTLIHNSEEGYDIAYSVRGIEGYADMIEGAVGDFRPCQKDFVMIIASMRNGEKSEEKLLKLYKRTLKKVQAFRDKS